jgi:hypothetical protein
MCRNSNNAANATGEQPYLANEVKQQRYLCFDVMAQVFIAGKRNI